LTQTRVTGTIRDRSSGSLLRASQEVAAVPLSVALWLCLTASFSPATIATTPVEHTVHSDYFEKNNSGLTGAVSYLVIEDRQAFDDLFGLAVTMGTKPKILPADAFASKMVVALIKRGGEFWEYKVEGVTEEDGVLTVRYTAKSGDGKGARFASPLIISLPKKAYREVVFVESGKEVGRVTRKRKDEEAPLNPTAAVGSVPTRSSAPQPKLSVLIVDGMNNHDWERATRILKAILLDSSRFTVDVSTSPPASAPAEQWQAWKPIFARYDVAVMNFNGGHTDKGVHCSRDLEKSLEDYVNRGGGLVVYHAANNSFPNWAAYNQMIGLGWRDKNYGPSLVVSGEDGKVVTVPRGQGLNPGHGPEHDFVVTVLDGDHPITRGMPKTWLHPHE
jgi:Trehalose utilisation